ncbi:MAG: TonB-dependent receptor [Casimicrobiaceae bacterium]|nr:TonB-dependent receptor [Casimicrobiaceae bacterium]MDW8312325.1 TonB-dependent receptor [Burkholderiales bacterium]
MTRQDIERSGATSIEELIRVISATTSSGSVSVASSSGATTGSISTVSLRGLSSNRTLVLINGRRLAPYGAPTDSVSVDIDAIPLAAIERIEVLKDGASAIYGSDAIAGVVNIILRKDFQGAEVSASYGAALADGKGDVTRVSAAAGFGNLARDRYNISVVGSYSKFGSLFGRDREFARSGINIPESNFAGSSRTFPANFNFIGGPGGTYNPTVPQCSPENSTFFIPEFSRTICWFDTAPFVTLIPTMEQAGLSANARFALGSDWEGYLEGSFSRKRVNVVIQPSPIDSAFGIPFTLKPTSPFYPTDFVRSITGGRTPDLRIRYRPFITGNRDLTDRAENTRLVAGAQGVWAGWDINTYLLHSTSKVSEFLNGGYFRIYGNNGINPATGRPGDPTGPGIVPLLATGLVNPFGPTSPEIVAQARATNFVGEAFKAKTSLTSLNAVASREFARFGAGPVSVALGGEYRQEKFDLASSEALRGGDISGYGGNFQPIAAKRDVQAAFAELSTQPFAKSEATLALRFDRYARSNNPNDVQTAVDTLIALDVPRAIANQLANSPELTGSASSFQRLTGKVGLKYAVTPQLSARATWATGFRAPSLLELYNPLNTGVTEPLSDPARCRGANANNPNDCATQFNTFYGGNSRLKPERSQSITLGAIFEPIRDVSLTLDYFQIDVKDIIGSPSASFLLANEALYSRRVIREATSDIPGLPGSILVIDTRLENFGRTKIKGFDFDLLGRFDALGAKWTTRFIGTYLQQWATQNEDGSFSSSIGLTSNSTFGFLPRLRYRAELTYNRGPWEGTLAYNWQSRFTDVCGNLVDECTDDVRPRRGSYEIWDAQIRYTGVRDLTVTVGVKNLLDRNPPYVNGNGGAF